MLRESAFDFTQLDATASLFSTVHFIQLPVPPQLLDDPEAKELFVDRVALPIGELNDQFRNLFQWLQARID